MRSSRLVITIVPQLLMQNLLLIMALHLQLVQPMDLGWVTKHKEILTVQHFK